tara:strand:- start:279 stop:1121 length:843 start_codon:yes stop_codon:yes gene_type:complete
MSMNKVKLSQIIRDFLITLDGDDHGSSVSDIALRNIALRGIREFGFDISKKIKSIKRTIETNQTIVLPDDYVDLSKLGVVGADGFIYILNENKNINYSRRMETADDDASGTRTDTFDESPLNIPANSIGDRVDDKTGTEAEAQDNDFDFYVFQNYLYQGGEGRLYGAGGGYSRGEYRINLDQNRIELEMNTDASEVVLEYIADEARAGDPEVHVYQEEALRSYMYYKIIERKSNVPANEKARAKAEYYNERRKANARMSNFTKDEALKVIRKNFRQAPKY